MKTLWYNPRTGKTARSLMGLTGINDNDGCYEISTEPVYVERDKNREIMRLNGIIGKMQESLDAKSLELKNIQSSINTIKEHHKISQNGFDKKAGNIEIDFKIQYT